MYGIVNKAVEDLVLTIAGQDAWLEITKAAGYQDVEIAEATNYEDEVTLKIAVAACDYLCIELDALLHAFGKHWVLYTEKKGWAKHFMLPADSFIGVLEGLDEVHARVKDAMPDGNMPFFGLTRNSDDYTLEYHSVRDGFAPMVLGILEGLAESFGEQWQFTHVAQKREWGFDKFVLKQVLDDRADLRVA